MTLPLFVAISCVCAINCQIPNGMKNADPNMRMVDTILLKELKQCLQVRIELIIYDSISVEHRS